MTTLTFGSYTIDTLGLTAKGIAKACRGVVAQLESDLSDCLAARDPVGAAAAARHLAAAADRWHEWQMVVDAGERAPL